MSAPRGGGAPGAGNGNLWETGAARRERET